MFEATQADKSQRTLDGFFLRAALVASDQPPTEPVVGVCIEVDHADSRASLDALTQVAMGSIQTSHVEMVRETNGKLSLKTTPVGAFAGIGSWHAHTAVHQSQKEVTAVQPASSSVQKSVTLPPLPPLPPLNGRKKGKYISNGSSRCFKPRVVYYNGGKRANPCCIHDECKTMCYFGPIGKFGRQHAIYCAEHHDPELHEDVVSKRCIHEGCKTRCSFGPIGKFGRQHAVYCEEHHDPELHEDVVHKRCIHEGCKTMCSFGPIGKFGSQHAVYCAEHHDPELHEDVVSKRCIHEGCKTMCSFGPIGKFGRQHAVYCEEHNDPELHEDVVNKRCSVEECQKIAIVHDPNNPSIHVCVACAGNIGLVAKTRTGASMACSVCFDELELHLGHKITWRERYDDQCNRLGAEKYGLLRNHPRLHPDGFVECDDGSHKGTVYEFHGDYYHGYPPWHPKHESVVFCGQWGPDLYKKTLDRMHLFKDDGYKVVYIWESDWLSTKKKGSEKSIGDVLREL